MSWSGVGPRRRAQLRLYVGGRDGMRCQRPGCRCGGCELTWTPLLPNTLTAGHVVAVEDGGTHHPDNLRAECAAGNYGDGADRTNRKRRSRSRNTSRAW